MRALDACKKAVKYAEQLGVDECEAFASYYTVTDIEIEKMHIKSAYTRFIGGIGVRVVKDRRVGFSYTNKVHMRNIKKAIEDALSIAKTRKPDERWKSLPSPGKYPVVRKLYDKEVKSLESDELVEMALEMIDAAKDVNKKVASMSGSVLAGYSVKAVVNSQGIECIDKGTVIGGGLYVISRDGGDVGVGYDFDVKRTLREFDHIKPSKNASEISMKHLGKRKIEGGKMTIVLHPFAVADLLQNIFAPEIQGDRAYKKQTPYADRLGEKVASGKLTIIDDGRYPGGYASAKFDAEGVSTKRTVIISRGRLMNFIYNSYWANVVGKESTGNAVRKTALGNDYSVEPTVGISNLIVKPSKYSLDEMISSIKNGLYCVTLLGSHTANPETGTFSVVAYIAFKIENGEITHPVKQAMIAGRLPELLLKNVDMVGSEVKMVYNVIAPHISFRNVTVSC